MWTARGSGLTISEDGRRILCVGRVWAVVVDAASCKATHTFLSDHERNVLVGRTERAMEVYVDFNLMVQTPVAMSPDGNRVAIVQGRFVSLSVLLVDLVRNTATTQELPAECLPYGCVKGACFSPDGTKLACVFQRGDIFVWDVALQEVVFKGVATEGTAADTIAFAPDGTRIAATGPPNCVRIWNLSDPDEAPRALTGHSEHIYQVKWSSDGCFLISGGGDGLMFWDTTSWRCVHHCSDVGLVYSMSLGMRDTRLATLNIFEEVFMLWRLVLVPARGSEAPRVDLELQAMSRGKFEARRTPRALLGDFEGAELDPMFQRCVQNDWAREHLKTDL